MPLSFLVPAFLAALAALAVPVIVHLRRREKERPTKFPSLMFLRRIPMATARHRRVTDWPLLLLRALILALAVAAFARPVIRPRAAVTGARVPGKVAVLLDRSMSMGHLAVWPEALDSARAIINGLDPADRVAVVAFDEDASVLQPLTLDHAAALAAIDQIKPTARGTRYAAGLRAAREVLGREAGTGGEALVITDLQRSGAGGLAGLSLPTNIAVRAVHVGPQASGNTAITGVDVQRLPGDERGRLAVAARVVTRGLAAPRPVHLTLNINGRDNASRDATLPADGALSVAFDPVPMPVGMVRVGVTVNADSLTLDDRFDAVVPAEVTRRVLLLAPSDASPDETLFLERALATGRDPALQVERTTAAGLNAERLRGVAAIFLYDVPVPGSDAVNAWLSAGGGLVEIAGVRLGARGLSDARLPGTVRGMVDRREDRGGVFGDLSLEHPIFAPFRAGGPAALGSAHFYRYPRVEPTETADLIASFDDGRPALLERTEGEGRVLLDVVPVDAVSGDFPLQPAYLPFIRRLAVHAAGQAAVPLWRTTGEGWLVPGTLRNPVIRTPSGELIRPEPHQGVSAVTFEESGFFTGFEGRASGDPAVTIAVNPPARESDLTPMDPRELLVGVGQDTVASSIVTAATLADAETRQRLWRVMLIVAALALVAETIVASRGWRGTAAQTIGTSNSGSES